MTPAGRHGLGGSQACCTALLMGWAWAHPLSGCVQAVLATVSRPVYAPGEMPDMVLALRSPAGATRRKQQVYISRSQCVHLWVCGCLNDTSHMGVSQGRKCRNLI